MNGNRIAALLLALIPPSRWARWACADCGRSELGPALPEGWAVASAPPGFGFLTLFRCPECYTAARTTSEKGIRA